MVAGMVIRPADKESPHVPDALTLPLLTSFDLSQGTQTIPCSTEEIAVFRRVCKQPQGLRWAFRSSGTRPQQPLPGHPT